MKNRLLAVLIAMNLVIGNGILLFSGLGALLMSFIGGSETIFLQFLLHALCSLIAVLTLRTIAHTIKRRTVNVVLLLVLSVLGAIAVPFVSTYMMFFGYAVVLAQPKLINPALFSAVAAAVLSIKYWLPFAVLNFSVFVAIGRNTRSANQAL